MIPEEELCAWLMDDINGACNGYFFHPSGMSTGASPSVDVTGLCRHGTCWLYCEYEVCVKWPNRRGPRILQVSPTMYIGYV